MMIELDLTHPAPPQAVFEMLTDPEFIEKRCAASDALSFTQAVTTDGPNTVVSVERTLSTAELPELLRNFARHGIKVHEILTWGPPADDGGRDVQVALDFVGQPMKMRGNMRLVPTPNGSALAVRAELKAAIPLLGGKVEKVTAPFIIKAIKTEEKVGHEWLTNR
ncbi:uncharacterized protein DUF2505 [Jatrophihabitans sp. GAS493]|uniref:DUF2505 domain-containing protein n=1 Tax=Jatrophihabitans sp. GAS493 TaxID=1907575 RepID=UPI000BB6BA99|nr:DUF2505 domain-containing protein [Jatrophihabitans sp. GAS493]SOD72356.1 uncharacterized protein DUF2505 [Jatrophihabitans sp. GAS493]